MRSDPEPDEDAQREETSSLELRAAFNWDCVKALQLRNLVIVMVDEQVGK